MALSAARGGVGTLMRYEGLEKIGEGTYGFVYQGRDKYTGETVALKKMLIYKESSGFPLCALREIKCLNSLRHNNIVHLREIVTSKGCEHLDHEDSAGSRHAAAAPSNPHLMQCGSLYLVFDYIEHDLAGLIDVKYKFNMAEIQSLMKQLFEALDFLHSKNIMHRDVKPSNLLISQRLKLQLADFGLARSTDTLLQNVPVLGGSASGMESGRNGSDQWCCDYDYHPAVPPSAMAVRGGGGKSRQHPVRRTVPGIAYTNNVITLWYRPPELLLGGQSYGCSVDIWSAGCIFAELFILKPVFPGKKEIEQFDLICKLIGTPSEETWSGIYDLPLADSLMLGCSNYTTNLRTSCAGVIPSTYLDLLERLLVADPNKRSSARLALGNRFFLQNVLKPGESAGNLRLDQASSFHEFQTKKRKYDAAMKEKTENAGATADSEANTTMKKETAVGMDISVEDVVGIGPVV